MLVPTRYTVLGVFAHACMHMTSLCHQTRLAVSAISVWPTYPMIASPTLRFKGVTALRRRSAGVHVWSCQLDLRQGAHPPEGMRGVAHVQTS